MKSMRVEVCPAVFQWLRESSGWSVEEVARRLKTSAEVVHAIEKGERQPTLRQLKELSKAYKRPLAAFLLSEPITESPLPKDYRMLPTKKDVFHKKTIQVIRKVRGLQDVGRELLINFNDSAKPGVRALNSSDDPEMAARTYRKAFDLSVDTQTKFKDSYRLYNFLRDALEELNVLVFQFSMPLKDLPSRDY